MLITGSVDLSGARSALDTLQHRQAPFAAALTMTRLANAVQEKAREELPGRFPDSVARGGKGMRWVSRGIRVERATKSQPLAAVYTNQWFMYFQEAGGVKRPIEGVTGLSAFHQVTHTAFMAIPHGKLKRGGIRWSPSEVLRQPRTFVNVFRNTWWFIGQRLGDTQYPLAVLYVLKPTVQLEPRFGLAETAHMVVKQTDIVKEFNAAMAEAVRTSR